MRTLCSPVDQARGLYWTQRAAEKGHTDLCFNYNSPLCDEDACFNMFYSRAADFDTTGKEAIHWLHMAASRGNVNALNHIATLGPEEGVRVTWEEYAAEDAERGDGSPLWVPTGDNMRVLYAATVRRRWNHVGTIY